MRAVGLIFISLLCFAFAAPSAAHEIRPGYLQITETAQPSGLRNSEAEIAPEFNYDITWKAPIRLGRPLAVTPRFDPDCEMIASASPKVDGTSVVTVSQLTCTLPLNGTTISLMGLDATLTDVLVRFAPLDGAPQTVRATNDAPTITLAVDPSRWEVAKTYFILGVEHIWFGFDHLLFVLGLVLLIKGRMQIVKTITAFTVAHSVTLIATTMGWISLSIAPVEAVIALSIVFLATEIASKQTNKERFTQRKPWVIASAFGLLHGFGFAGALSEIGMPFEDVPTALLTFNLGVEAGQLAFVGVILIVLALIERIKLRGAVELVSSYAMGSIAIFWLIQRVI